MEQLGIEPILLLAQVVNFVIIVVVLTRLLYRPILTMLERRKREIEEGLRLTQKMQAEEEKLKEKGGRMLDNAQREGRVIIEEARRVAREEAKEMLAQARVEAEEVVAKGRVEAERLKDEGLRQLRKEAVSLAATMAQRLLSKVLTSEQRHAIVAKHLKELESMISS